MPILSNKITWLLVFAKLVEDLEACQNSLTSFELSDGIAVFQGNHTGRVDFKVTPPRMVNVVGSVDGFEREKMHGVHIHETGDIDNGCLNANAHWNPFNKNHGGVDSRERHEGDLGNAMTDVNGVLHINVTVEIGLLDPRLDFIGLALVVHAQVDDLGRFPDIGSRTTGNSGGRLACAVIGRTSSYKVNKAIGKTSPNIVLLFGGILPIILRQTLYHIL
ncbi:Extracellular superoxide dismutase [Cu-Zn] [Clonorchis sinensis]|uniref:Superoxide dismutase [Cu-Zn] n=2 Tax=Clonorchis sinensis TaxID=79923 RepID=A0A3R7CHN9_CLOSI|nr:Extracellular superoxide dismutase [Cu-Zn] [Clonorchis sinensis]